MSPSRKYGPRSHDSPFPPSHPLSGPTSAQVSSRWPPSPLAWIWSWFLSQPAGRIDARGSELYLPATRGARVRTMGAGAVRGGCGAFANDFRSGASHEPRPSRPRRPRKPRRETDCEDEGITATPGDQAGVMINPGPQGRMHPTLAKPGRGTASGTGTRHPARGWDRLVVRDHHLTAQSCDEEDQATDSERSGTASRRGQHHRVAGDQWR